MKKLNMIHSILLIFLISFIATPVSAQKQKKEKKSYTWEMPSKLTNIKDFDEYLFSCDTLWNDIQNYKEAITFYTIDSAKVDVNGTTFIQYRILDDQGNPRNKAKTKTQLFHMIMNGTAILLDATTISLQTATATLSLSENPLLAFSYGKYLKGGPKIVQLAYKEVKEMITARKEQMALLRRLEAQDKSKDIEGLTETAKELAYFVEPKGQNLNNMAETTLESTNKMEQLPEDLVADETTMGDEEMDKLMGEIPEEPNKKG